MPPGCPCTLIHNIHEGLQKHIPQFALHHTRVTAQVSYQVNGMGYTHMVVLENVALFLTQILLLACNTIGKGLASMLFINVFEQCFDKLLKHICSKIRFHL